MSMFNRVKSAIVSAVGGIDHSTNHSDGDGAPLGPKFPYNRPHFLNLNISEEVPLSGDHRVRPIIVPRDREALPWSAGYAECVNSGKSQKNEDQATVYQFVLPKRRYCEWGQQLMDVTEDINVTYFGIFDGHAGYGAAVHASKQLHYIIEEKLNQILPQIWEDMLGLNRIKKTGGRNIQITKQDLVCGVLEHSFLEMDQLIADDRDKYLAAGGCTALVILLLLDRVYIANAGDSRAVHCKTHLAIPMSFDLTPESEDIRIRTIAEMKPELLCGEYTSLEYQREPKYSDIGKQIPYRDAYCFGWIPKTITKDDLKLPLISGEGKRSRLMNTIGVTRGFGDHDLKAINTRVPIKPFLNAHPEVNILDMRSMDLNEHDVIIMGTDGLWDVTSNDKAGDIVHHILVQFIHEQHKYISAAQALVANARGKPWGECSWRTSEGRAATGDDVSVFVIPLLYHYQMHEQFSHLIRDKINEIHGDEHDLAIGLENSVSISED